MPSAHLLISVTLIRGTLKEPPKRATKATSLMPETFTTMVLKSHAAFEKPLQKAPDLPLAKATLRSMSLLREPPPRDRDRTWLLPDPAVTEERWSIVRVGEEKGDEAFLALLAPPSQLPLSLLSRCSGAGSPQDAPLGVRNGANTMAGLGRWRLQLRKCSW